MKSNVIYTVIILVSILLSGCANQNANPIERNNQNQEHTDMTAEPISFGGENTRGDRQHTTQSPKLPSPSPGGQQNIFTDEAQENAQNQNQPNQPESGQEDSEQDESATSTSNQFQQEVTHLTNKEREKNGLAILEIDHAVEEVAQKKSEDMATHNYFSHTSPTYGSPFEMLQQFGVDYTTASENIASGQKTPAEVVKGWMNSPGHRKNILNEEVTHIGVGYAENGGYWTQLFIGK